MELQQEPLELDQKAVSAGKVAINKEWCKGCSYCVEFCPRKVLKMSQEISPKGYTLAAVEDPARCSGCGICEMICPEFAIRVVSKNAKS